MIFRSCRRASRRSAQRFLRVCGLNFGHQSPPFLSSINTHLVPKLGTGWTLFAPAFFSLLILENSIFLKIKRSYFNLLLVTFTFTLVTNMQALGETPPPLPSLFFIFFPYPYPYPLFSFVCPPSISLFWRVVILVTNSRLDITRPHHRHHPRLAPDDKETEEKLVPT